MLSKLDSLTEEMAMFRANAMGFFKHPVLGRSVLPEAVWDGVDLIHTTAAPPTATTVSAAVAAVVDFRTQVLRGAGAPAGLDAVRASNELSLSQTAQVVLGLQHAPSDILDVRDGLQSLSSAGVSIMQLMYGGDTRFGGGWDYPRRSLTDGGMRLIDAMAECGMILDLSHAGHQTARDALDYIRRRGLGSKIPVCVTHTGCYSVYPHPRNLPDDVLEGVVELRGVVGLYALTFGLHQTDNTIEGAFLPHLRHLVQLVGAENVCIGSDTLHVTETADETTERMRRLAAMTGPDSLMGVRSPDYLPELNGPRQFENLERALAAPSLEISPESAAGILGRNFLKFLRRALPA